MLSPYFLLVFSAKSFIRLIKTGILLLSGSNFLSVWIGMISPVPVSAYYDMADPEFFMAQVPFQVVGGEGEFMSFYTVYHPVVPSEFVY